MRILILQNYYKEFGGDNVVVSNEMALLQKRGHEVELWSTRNDDLTGPSQKADVAVNLVHSRRSYEEISAAIKAFQPDLTHFHNIFPRITPAGFKASHDAGVPTVHTLHDYRSVCCAAAFLYRRGRICELCVKGSSYWGAVHRCYRGSATGSMLVARMLSIHRRRATLGRTVDRFVALTNESRARFVAAGLPADRISVKGNFSNDPGEAPAAPREGALFVGRLSPEKGIDTLAEAWAGLPVPLTIVGDGPMMRELRAARLPGVELHGRRPHAEVFAEMGRARFLVMPSKWYEGFPMVIVEAFACGLPVIASDLGTMAELVEDGVSGLLFPAGDAGALARAVAWASAEPEKMERMGCNARRAFLARHTPEANYDQLMAIYRLAGADC